MARNLGDVATGQQLSVQRAELLVVGVDPANTCGWSAWKGGKLLGDGTLPGVDRQGGAKGVDVLACYRVFQDLRKRYSPEAPGVLVVENQNPLPPKMVKEDVDEEEQGKLRAVAHRGMEALMREVEARQTWETLVLLYGWQIVRVFPVTWQSALLNRRPGVKRPELKKRSVAYARSLGAVAKDDNAADATCIGCWWIRGGNPPEKKKPGRRA